MILEEEEEEEDLKIDNSIDKNGLKTVKLLEFLDINNKNPDDIVIILVNIESFLKFIESNVAELGFEVENVSEDFKLFELLKSYDAILSIDNASE
ncbi:hypothetical protein WICMUC_001625 [Wickerhamomyces mucosus]|uniref:Uncharacterized protein n=1 Tax=Wickerhamomyces mucosus TaxID=1378264 RepID=A0A9P8TGP2_9ASCO|nr:hypothetical protein WICMUC_001625 [Wickerhamomyces mucosus]